jgi:hypothetical protein
MTPLQNQRVPSCPIIHCPAHNEAARAVDAAACIDTGVGAVRLKA